MTRETPPADTWHARVLATDPDGFARFLAKRETHPEFLEDVALAYLALQGDATALTALDRDVLVRAGRSVRRVESSAAFRDEVLQQVRTLLLLGSDGGPARLSLYLGRGPLVGWVRTVVMGTALNLLRDRDRHPADGDDSALFKLAHSRDDLELRYLVARYRGEFEQSLREALGTLDTRTRNVLRMKFADRLTLAQIGRMYKVHATTVMRWLDEATAQLAQETRRRLAERVKGPAAEVDSVLSLVRGQIDASLTSLLGDTAVSKR